MTVVVNATQDHGFESPDFKSNGSRPKPRTYIDSFVEETWCVDFAMQQLNPCEPPNVAVASALKRHIRWQRVFAASGLLLLAIAGLLFYSAESTMVYTSYSTTIIWPISSLDDQYYVSTMPMQIMIAFGIAAIGAIILIAATILRVFRTAFNGHVVNLTILRSMHAQNCLDDDASNLH